MRIDPGEIDRLEETAYQIRRLSLEMITYGCWGHICNKFMAKGVEYRKEKM